MDHAAGQWLPERVPPDCAQVHRLVQVDVGLVAGHPVEDDRPVTTKVKVALGKSSGFGLAASERPPRRRIGRELGRMQACAAYFLDTLGSGPVAELYALHASQCRT